MNRKAVFAVLGAGTLWGFISPFVRAMTAAGLTALQIAFLRVLVGGLLMTVVLAIKDPKLLRVRPRDLWHFMGTGIISLTLFNWCYFTVINLSQVSVAVALLYTSPIFIVVLSAILFHERITGRKVAALCISFFGSVLTAGLFTGGGTLTPTIFLFGIGSGLFYGLYSIFGTAALKHYDTLTVTTYTFLFGLLGTLFVGQPLEALRTVAQNPAVLPYTLGLGVFCTVLPYLLYTYGLSRMDSGIAAILVTVEPVVGALAGWMLFQESIGLLRWGGIGLILGAVVLLNRERR